MRICCILCVLVVVLSCSSDRQPTAPGPTAGPPCEGYPAQATSPYLLPYPPGAGYRVIQGNCSQGPTHTATSVYKYSYDFEMAIGTPIHAARDGVVLGIREAGTDFNGTNILANYVWVTHDDGTIARYWHLTRDGALVEPGQRVRAGELIALSGATGLSDTPHLHFDQAECGPTTCKSQPVVFRNTDANPTGLQFGRTYVALP